MELVVDKKLEAKQTSLFNYPYHPQQDEDSPEDFLKRVQMFGIKSFSKIPQSILDDEQLVKKLIKMDTYSFFYLPAYYQKDDFFMETEKNHEILLLEPINKKLSKRMIHWIIDYCPDYPFFKYFNKPISQLENPDEFLMEKIGLGYMIKGLEVPRYLKKTVEKHEGKTIEELKNIKKFMINYEQMGLFLDSKDNAEKEKKTKL